MVCALCDICGYIVLHRITSYYIVLHRITSYYIVLHRITSYYIVLHVASCCSFLALHAEVVVSKVEVSQAARRKRRDPQLWSNLLDQALAASLGLTLVLGLDYGHSPWQSSLV